MIINFDCDDTLFDLLTPWVKTLNEAYGTNANVTDITDWDIAKYFPSITKKQVFAPLTKRNFWKNVKPIVGSLECLYGLISRGHEVNIITSTHYKNVRYKMEMITKYLPMVTWDNVIITSNKQRVKCDILVDDGQHNLIDGDYYKILMNKPHNHQFNEKENGIFRAFSLYDAFEEIIRYEEEQKGL